MSDDEPIYRPGRVIAGRYRITSPLSQGGMGAVYLAQQVSLGRDVALKVILERGSDPELIKRFDIEARAVCQLKHPNIITYHDYGRDEDGHPFLVMEFLAGYAGSKLVYGERRPRLEDLVHVMAQVCSALNEAHQKGIIHRDLKWSNVMICPQSHDPYFTKLIDFGIMKVATDGSSGDQRAMTRTGMLLGTPEYMSPEAICGMPIDGRADQYSLAVMLWEALEGQRPFQAASHFELLRQQVQELPPPFENARPVIEAFPALGEVLARGLEKHPDDRYDDILAFQTALMAAIKPEAPAVGTAPGRPAARRDAAHKTPVGLAAPISKSGMPAPRPRTNELGASSGDPRPVDTRVKTGREPAEPARRKVPLALVAGLVVVAAGAFGAVLALTGPKDDAAASPQSEAPAAAIAPAPDAAGSNNPGRADAEIATASANAPGTDAAAPTRDTAQPLEVMAPATDTASPRVAADTAVAPDAVTSVASSADAGPSLAARDPGAKPAEPRAEATKDVGSALPKERASGEGKLTLITDPWTRVSIDGQFFKNSPLLDVTIKAGRHTFSVANPTEFKGAYTFTLNIKPGASVTHSVKLADHLEKMD